MVCVWILSPHIFHLKKFNLFPFVCLNIWMLTCDEYATPAQVPMEVKRGQGPQSLL